MKRSTFVSSSIVASVATGVPLWSLASRIEGTTTTQVDLFGRLPRARTREWTRIILGAGAAYQKQIGAGIEIASDGRRLPYFETQIGSPGGSCNPSSMRKSYLEGARFGSLLDTYPLLASVGRTENLVYRFGDLADGSKPGTADTTLRLLDESYLYDSRPIRIVSVAPAMVHVASRNVETTHVVAEFASSTNKNERLRRIELWHEPTFPFGVAQYHAEIVAIGSFKARVYSCGGDFASILPMKLSEVRAITPNGTYGQLPEGIGAS